VAGEVLIACSCLLDVAPLRAGVGLRDGLPIVREHGGEIRARSEGDWSSIVTIYLSTRENDDRRRKPDRRDTRSDRRRRLA